MARGHVFSKSAPHHLRKGLVLCGGFLLGLLLQRRVYSDGQCALHRTTMHEQCTDTAGTVNGGVDTGIDVGAVACRRLLGWLALALSSQ